MSESDFPIWIAPVWLGYGLLGLYFMFGRDAARKRRFLAPYMIGAGVLFIAFVLVMGVDSEAIFVLAPIVALISWLNVRNFRFCDACGATVMRHFPFERLRFCNKCGAPLPER